MTICNMSIEAGARAGMVAPDETTFAYLKGRPHAPARAGLGRRGRLLEDARRPTTTPSSTPRSTSTPNEIEPFVTWGTNPGQGVSLSETVPDPADDRRPERARGRRARAGVHGPRGGHADEGDPGGCGLHGLVHQQPHRRPARLRLGHQGAQEGRRRPRHGRPRQRPRAHRGRGRGHRQDRRGVRRRVAVRRLLDVPRDEPRPARAGGALRIHLQPQLRGPAGQGRPHPPRLAARRGGHRHPRNAVQPVGSRVTRSGDTPTDDGTDAHAGEKVGA